VKVSETAVKVSTEKMSEMQKKIEQVVVLEPPPKPSNTVLHVVANEIQIIQAVSVEFPLPPEPPNTYLPARLEKAVNESPLNFISRDSTMLNGEEKRYTIMDLGEPQPSLELLISAPPVKVPIEPDPAIFVGD
jgi:hypothetical protein